MAYREVYERWLADPAIDESTRQELAAIADNEKEIEDRFYRDLDFGTGGLRGVLGAGSNRLNIYTIRKATQGLANYILSQTAPGDSPSVVIAHDCRRMSPEFSEEAALVMSGNGIRAYVFDALRPTPVLSFAVRQLKCTAGIVITASHNPPEYNGYKVYWSDGGQVPYPRDEAIIQEVNAVSDFSQVKTMKRADAEAAGLFYVAKAELDDAYIDCVKAQSLHPEIIRESPLKIVYTPLHGTGNLPVRRALQEIGFKQVHVVAEQAEADGNFPTVDYPNPEDWKAFSMAVALGQQVDADILVATDPDCDRVGAVVKNKQGGYTPLTGNMTGLLLTEYLLSQLKAGCRLPENGAVLSTIVSTDMTKAVAAAYGVTYMDVLTGFKYIGEKIKEFEDGSYTYLFGFEESYGCLAGTYARDKDAVVTSLLICEAAAYYHSQGLSLLEQLEALYQKYGYYQESVESITLKGVEGLADMRRIMETLRQSPPNRVADKKVLEISDYLNKTVKHFDTGQTGATTLPISDVLYFRLQDGAWFCVRPSGTEPKIKLYFGVCVQNTDLDAARKEASELLSAISGAVRQLVDSVIR